MDKGTAPAEVFVTTYEHKHGNDADVFASREGALAARDAIARQEWEGMLDIPMPEDNVGEAYFSAMEGRGEYFHIERIPVKP